jgi:hypothetical protein
MTTNDALILCGTQPPLMQDAEPGSGLRKQRRSGLGTATKLMDPASYIFLLADGEALQCVFVCLFFHGRVKNAIDRNWQGCGFSHNWKIESGRDEDMGGAFGIRIPPSNIINVNSTCIRPRPRSSIAVGKDSGR